MNARIDVQTILGPDGQPAFVVLPYADFIKRFEGDADLVPNEVMRMVLKEGMSPMRAWREHLGLTQGELAQRLQVSQAAVAQFEATDQKLRKTSIKKIAEAMKITVNQLDW